MHLQRAAHGLGRRFQFLARAPAPHVGGDHLVHVIAAEGFIGLAEGGVGLLRGALAARKRLAWPTGPSSIALRPVRIARGQDCKARGARIC